MNDHILLHYPNRINYNEVLFFFISGNSYLIFVICCQKKISDICGIKFTITDSHLHSSERGISMKHLLGKGLRALVVCGVSVTMVGTAFSADKAVMEKGAKVYNEYCKTCHQATGAGIPKVYPPLAKSDYLKNTPKDKIIESVTLGLKGEITVNGQKYNNVMVALPAKYTDADAAAVITYVYNSWGNSGPTVTEAEVKKIRSKGKKK